MNESFSSQPKKELFPSTLECLTNSKLPNELKEMLKEKLEIGYCNSSQRYFHEERDYRYDNNSPLYFKRIIINVESIFNSFNREIEEVFRQKKNFLLIDCFRDPTEYVSEFNINHYFVNYRSESKRSCNSYIYSISDWISDNPITNLVIEYIHKILVEKGYNIYQKRIVERYLFMKPTLDIEYQLI